MKETRDAEFFVEQNELGALFNVVAAIKKELYNLTYFRYYMIPMWYQTGNIESERMVNP